MMSYSNACNLWQLIKRDEDVQGTYTLLFLLNAVKFLSSSDDMMDVLAVATFNDVELHFAMLIDSILKKMLGSGTTYEAIEHLRKLSSYIAQKLHRDAEIDESLIGTNDSKITGSIARKRAIEFLTCLNRKYTDNYHMIMIGHLYLAYILRNEVPIIISRQEYNSIELQDYESASNFIVRNAGDSTDRIYQLCRI